MYTARSREEDMVGLISAFAVSESEQTNTLVELMSQATTGRHQASVPSMNSLIRGLYTKNSKLTSLLGRTAEALHRNMDEQNDIFKNFVTEFIMWMDDGCVVLLERYLNALHGGMDNETIAVNLEGFSSPIVNCHNYVKFAEDAGTVLRNPYVVEKLISIRQQLEKILDEYYMLWENKKLDNIGFDDVRWFGASRSSDERVSSYFDVRQIVERSAHEMMFLALGENRVRCELVLLNLSGHKQNPHDALAILSVGATDSQPRSLVYPPFRVNELSVSSNNSKISLKPLDFSNRQNSSRKLSIEFSQKRSQDHWFQKLGEIFPTEESDSPVSDSFLIKSPINASSISGLGINIVSDSDREPSYMDLGEPPSVSPSVNSIARSPTIQSAASSPMRHPPELMRDSPASKNEDYYPQPRFAEPRGSFSSSIHSSSSSDLNESQYDRSIDLINKTLSGIHSNNSNTSISASQTYHIGSVNSSAVDIPHQHDTPKSSSAEVENRETESTSQLANGKSDAQSSISGNYQSSEKLKFESAPDLSDNKPQDSMFKLSTGSVVDISNFGKDFKPSFSISKDLSELAKPDTSKSASSGGKGTKNKKKSILKIFGKPKENKKQLNNYPDDSNGSSETLVKGKNGKSGRKVTNSSETTIDLSNKTPQTDSNGSSSAAATSSQQTKPKSKTPAPFALPSLDSDCNVASLKNDVKSTNKESAHSSPSSGGNLQEEVLVIPQATKDIINADSSIDFYISPTDPKSMKVTKWRQKHGTWKMLTVNENLFMKIVVNYEVKKGWIIIFKEEFDEEYNEEVDVPILLLDLSPTSTNFGQSSALDIQIDSTNSVTSRNMLILIRSVNGSLANAIFRNLENSLNALKPNSPYQRTLESSRRAESDFTLASSMMEDNNMTSNSSTLMSIYSPQQQSASQPTAIKKDSSTFSIRSTDIANANILSNPENKKRVVLDHLTIRLQKQMESFDSVNDLSSWKVLSMYSLSIQTISDRCSGDDYLNIILRNDNDNEHSIIDFNWLIKAQDIGDRVEKIGKAGLLVMVDEKNLYLIECRGKKEFKLLYDVLA